MNRGPIFLSRWKEIHFNTEKLFIRPWCWENLKAKGEEGSRGWDGLMASSTQWTWTWTNPRRWLGTRRPGVLQSMGSQKVRYDLATEKHNRTMWGFFCIPYLILPVSWGISCLCPFFRWENSRSENMQYNTPNNWRGNYQILEPKVLSPMLSRSSLFFFHYS